MSGAFKQAAVAGAGQPGQANAAEMIRVAWYEAHSRWCGPQCERWIEECDRGVLVCRTEEATARTWQPAFPSYVPGVVPLIATLSNY